MVGTSVKEKVLTARGATLGTAVVIPSADKLAEPMEEIPPSRVAAAEVTNNPIPGMAAVLEETSTEVGRVTPLTATRKIAPVVRAITRMGPL